MPRYLIESTFVGGLVVPIDDHRAEKVRALVGVNVENGVNWVHSYVTPDRAATFCLYDGPSSDAVRRAAETTGMPVNRIAEVMVLDPYFHR
jgi:hypothetical protein